MNTHTLDATQAELFIDTMIDLDIGDFFHDKKREAINALGTIAIIQKNGKTQTDTSEKVAEINAENAWSIAKDLINNNKVDVIMTHTERQNKNIRDAFNKAQDEKIKDLVVFAEEVVSEIKAVENGASAYSAEDKIKASASYKKLFPLSR